MIRFEKLLLETSTRLLNLPPDHIGKEIEQGLSQVVNFLGGDRGSIFELDAGQSLFHLLYSFTLEGTPQPPLTFHEEEFPWLSKRLRQGQVISLSAQEEISPGGARDKESLARLGIKSILVIPLAAGESILGAVTFASLREERAWSEPVVQRLRLVGVIFANALARKKSDCALRQAELDYSTAGDDIRNVGSVQALADYETYVSLGQSRPFTSMTVTGGVYYPPVVSQSTGFRDVQTGFYATPRVNGYRVTLEISSRQQSLASAGHDAPVTTGSVNTTVTGRLGEWLQIGGSADSSGGSSSGLITWGARSDLTQYSAWVKVDEVR